MVDFSKLKDHLLIYSCGMEESKSALAMKNAPNVDKPDETYDFTCDNEENVTPENRNLEDKVVEGEINNPEEGEGGGGQNAKNGEGLETVSFCHCICLQNIPASPNVTGLFVYLSVR